MAVASNCSDLKSSDGKQTWEQAWKDAQRSGKVCQSAGTPYMLTKNPVRSTTRTFTEILTELQDKKLPEFDKAQSDDYSRSDDNESNTYYYYYATSVLLQREPTRSPRSSNICPVLFTILVIQSSPVTNFAPRVCSVSLPSLSSLSHIPIEFSVLQDILEQPPSQRASQRYVFILRMDTKNRIRIRILIIIRTNLL